MTVLWTAPLALLGLVLIALPIAVHLLVRHQVRTLAYPSLRFLRETQLAAFRRHRLEDLALLICRCAIVACAALALAGPVLQTASRNAEQSRRTSRAIVALGGNAPDVASRLADGAFVSIVIRRDELKHAIHDAIRWLDAQPRSAREIVIAGDLRRGLVTPTDLAVVPRDVGVRFEQTGNDLPAQVTVPVLARRNDRLVRIDQAATLTADSTRIVDGAAVPVEGELVSILAGSSDTALAEAALRAALEAGVPWRDFDKRVLIVWESADAAAVNARSNGAEIVRMAVPAPAARAADAVRTVLLRAGGMNWVEPIAITRAELDAWSRQPGAPSANAPVADEGDRRWLWALALALLALEWWLRKPRSAAAEASAAQEARIA